ncbi:MAG: trypsin-like peptidase domain-containing protein [Terrimicrobiaceae bacterium]
MFRTAIFATLSLCLAGISYSASPVSKGLVRIVATSQEPNYLQPWSGGSVSGGSGSGFVIDGKRILTNAHVVSNTRFLTVSKEGDPAKYLARVLHVAHDCDLAMLTVDDPKFFQATTALQLGGIPAIESTVSVYGYPIGGDRLSVTRGVVSRIDFQPYSHSGVDAHLTIQIDAAINPGNSGGPVLQDGKVVGVAFQGYSGDVAQNVGYMIPTPVVARFLEDVKDGSYDRYMDIAVSYHSLHNPAMRNALGLPDNDLGVFVGEVYPGGASDGYLKSWDVILSIDGLPVSSDGTVPMDGDQVEMAEVVERKFKGDTVAFDVVREGKPLSVTVPLERPWPFAMQANAYDQKPRYLIYGGLVFQPLDANFINAHDPDDLRLRYHYDHFISQGLHLKKPEIVVLSNVLADPVNAYAGDFVYDIVETVNDIPIKNLDDLAKAIDAGGEYVVIKTVGPGRPLVLERKAAEDASPQILSRYGIQKDRNLVP